MCACGGRSGGGGRWRPARTAEPAHRLGQAIRWLRERQPEPALEAAGGAEPGASGDAHAAIDRADRKRRGGDVIGQLDPYRHATRGPRGAPFGSFGGERGEQRPAAFTQQRTARGQNQIEAGERLDREQLVQHRATDILAAAGEREPPDQLGVGADPPRAEPAPHGLGQRADGQHGAARVARRQ